MDVVFISNHDKLPSEKIGFNHPLYQIDEFLKLGYNVTYIVPSFNHFNKTQRIYNENIYSINEKFKVVLIKSISYSGNISVKRFLSHFLFSVSVFKYVVKLKKIDIIFLALPSPFLDIVCVFLKKIFKAELYVDFRDLWPELFEVYLTGILKIISWPFIKLLYLNRYITFKNASVITAVSNTYLKIAKRSNPNALSDVVYLGYDENLNHDKICQNNILGTLNIIYAGSLSHNYDVECLLSVIKIIDENYSEYDILFHVAGNGFYSENIQKHAVIHNKKLKFYGKLERESLNDLYSKCNVSLCIYDSKTLISFPAKIFELMFKKLPIINSLKGEVGELIENKRIGLNYSAGDIDSLLTQILIFYKNRNLLVEYKNNMNECKDYYNKENQYSKFSLLIKSKIK